MCHQSVGLIQTAIEKAGIPTISITLKPEVTYFLHVPRSAYIRFPYGYSVGPAFEPELQKEILQATLNLVPQIKTPGTIVKLPYRWQGSGNKTIPSADPRIVELKNEVEKMIDHLKSIISDMKDYAEEEQKKEKPNLYKINFYQSQASRAGKLISILDEDVSHAINGMKNLSGPIKYMREE